MDLSLQAEPELLPFRSRGDGMPRNEDPAGHCGILGKNRSVVDGGDARSGGGGGSSRRPVARFWNSKRGVKGRTPWEWRSSVCHRDSEWRMRPSHGKRMVSEPWGDTCCEGVARCGDWAGDVPGKCVVGVMGWLCVCRQG